jgi:hypothetical protein
MSSLTWEKRVAKGNSKGTGWISLPREIEERVELGTYYDLSMYDGAKINLDLTVKLVQYSGCWGFYIPKALCEKHSLIRKRVEIMIKESEYFPAQISADKRIYLPYSYVVENEIKENELYEIEIVVDGLAFGEVVLISKTDRSKISRRDEYIITIRLCAIPKKVRAKVKFIRKIKVLSPVKPPLPEEYFYIPSLFHGAIMGKIDPNEMIIFKGNHVPIITPITIKLEDYIHYFGCYYADGTKVGPGWSTSASTPEQAKYYIEKYNELIFNDVLDFGLTYSQKPSDKRKEEEVRKDLQEYWKREASIDIRRKRIKIRTTKHDNPLKWNRCGSLRICAYKTQVLDLHMGLLGEIVYYLKSCENKKHLWNFLFGILEGDGSVRGGNQRFGVGFSCHETDEIIRQSLDKLQINYAVDLSRIRNETGSGIQIDFWLFEVLSNLDLLYHNLFKYYPKRRKTIIERLLKQSTVRYIIGEINHLSPVSRIFFFEKTIQLDLIKETLIKLVLELSEGYRSVNTLV